ncbi:MAG TPA: galactokinase [Candidatus Limnocylindrales bacterium]|nr:galactokinase [Candidatus Limnocylindrales bacterium]
MTSPLPHLTERLAAAYPGIAGRGADVRAVRAPGRVNLIGEHTDYNDGLVLPAAIDREIRIAYIPTDDGRIELTREDSGEAAGMAIDEERPADGSWFDYVAGVATELRGAGFAITGLRGIVDSTLPMNAGLSSSAALELATAWALLDDGAPEADPLRLAQLAQRAENGYVGVNCGLMDQFACACAVAGAAMLFDCRSLEYRPVAIPDGLRLVVCHSGSSRRLGGSEYNTRRAQCEAGVAALARTNPGIRSLRDVTPELLESAASELDPVVLRRCRHVVAENERVRTTVAALEAGNVGAVGEAFAAGHASCRDLFEISSPELDALVQVANGVPGVVAARMTGGGFGGCTVNLVEPDAVDRLRTAVETDYAARTGLVPMVLPVDAVAGAGRIS